MNVTFTKVQGDWLEASFYEMVQLPDVEIPAKPALFDAEGKQVQAAEPARTEPGAMQRVEVAFVSYHPTQLDLIRADAAKHGADLAEHETMLAEWVAAYVPPPAPPVPVPARVTMRQARMALLAAGKLAGVNAAINTLPSPQKEAAQIEWEYSNEVLRHNGFVAQLGPTLGMTDADLDALFVLAAGL